MTHTIEGALTARKARWGAIASMMAALSLAACGGGGGGSASASSPSDTPSPSPPAPSPTPAAPSPAPANTLAALCSPTSWIYTPGNSVEVTSQSTVNGTVVSADDLMKAGSLTTYSGSTAYEFDAVHTSTVTVAGSANTTVLNVKGYSYPTAPAELTVYGSIATLTSGSGSTATTGTTTSVYSPPFVDDSGGLTAGGSISQTFTTTDTMVASVGGGAPETTTETTTVQQTVKFVDVEQITVAAGTYRTCRVDTTESTNGGNPVTSTEYLLAGYGVPVKTVAGGSTVEAASVKVNGQPY